ncbi:MAG: hypothetical protein U0798_19890 [Gemmataceae bacterium]
MDRLLEFLERVQQNGLIAGKLRGVLHIAIGRVIKTEDGTVISSGTTWRVLSNQLKAAKIDKELVRQIHPEPDEISPRDRERFWYSVIALARPDSSESIAEAEALIPLLAPLGYTVGALPVGFTASAPVPPKSMIGKSAADAKKMPPKKKL